MAKLVKPPRLTITAVEFAALMGWSLRQLWRKRSNGTLPVAPLPLAPGDSLKFPLRAVETFLGHEIDLDGYEFAQMEPAAEEPGEK